jgi:hypothetical protein
MGPAIIIEIIIKVIIIMPKFLGPNIGKIQGCYILGRKAL